MKIRITVGVDERYYKDEDEVVSALKKHPMTRAQDADDVKCESQDGCTLTFLVSARWKDDSLTLAYCKGLFLGLVIGTLEAGGASVHSQEVNEVD